MYSRYCNDCNDCSNCYVCRKQSHLTFAKVILPNAE
jgi:hypothetical protein